MVPNSFRKLVLATLPILSQPLLAMEEPDGSRTVGVVPPFHGQPVPPAWLRTTSCALAAVSCRHYVYEAYGDATGCWLVRYVNLPGRGETLLEVEQTFLFTSEGAIPETLGSKDIHYDPASAAYAGKTFVLVDRRDLMRVR